MPLLLLSRLRGLALLFLLASAMELPAFAAPSDSASPVAGDFLTTLNGESSPYRIRSVFVLPGHNVTSSAAERFDLEADAGDSEQIEPNVWIWKAPSQPGLYSLDLVPRDEDERVQVNVFVMVPYSAMKKNSIRGFRMGAYREGDGPYARPAGFIEVTEDNQDTWVSPRFQLKQFLCKQKGGFPKFLLLREALLIKLELILDKLIEEGVEEPALKVMSGFRTPAHNRSIGTVKNSRHTFGDAADVVVDSDEDGRMDDLNGDGKINFADSEFLKQVVLDVEAGQEVSPGGIGIYASSHSHGPFVHVDARGHVAHWTVMKVRKGKRKAKRKRRAVRT